MPYDPDTAIGGAIDDFPLTRLSLIHAAADDSGIVKEALSAIVDLYWKPAYKHLRRKWRCSNEEAKDSVQTFFAALLEQDILAKFDPARGTFRNYLRTCLDHFIQKQRESAGRLKRGGGRLLDFDSAERELAAASASSVEDLFLLEWRRQTFSLALADLREHCRAHAKDLPYRIFEQYDLAEHDRPTYADLASEHGIPVTTVTNHLAWARRELRRFAIARLAGVTSGTAELQRETRVLFEPS